MGADLAQSSANDGGGSRGQRLTPVRWICSARSLCQRLQPSGKPSKPKSGQLPDNDFDRGPGYRRVYSEKGPQKGKFRPSPIPQDS